MSIAATIEYLRENGLDALVDAYGVHTYPWADTAAKRRDQLEEDTLVECRSTAQGKPCWLTEWGLAADSSGCSGSDAPRASRMKERSATSSHSFAQGASKACCTFPGTTTNTGSIDAAT